MSKYFAVFFFVLISKICYSQHEQIKRNWKTVSITDKKYTTINYHVYKNEIDKTKPLILYLEGSGNFPLYYLNSNGRYSTSTTLDFKELSKEYHIAIFL